MRRHTSRKLARSHDATKSLAVHHGNGFIPSRDRQVQTKTTAPIRLLIVDGQEITRAGLRTILNLPGRITIVGVAGTMAAGSEETRRFTPDVALIQSRLPDGSGIDACRHIRALSPNTHVLILTNTAGGESAVLALQAGAAGLLTNTISWRDLVRAVEAVGNGQTIFDQGVFQRIATHLSSHLASTSDQVPAELSAQEQRVIEFVIEGKTNKEIAETLALSDKTVKNYVRHIYKKLQASNRAHATAIMLKRMRSTSGVGAAGVG